MISPRVLLQSRFTRQGLVYTVDVALDRGGERAVVVHRDGRAVALGKEQDGEWCLFGGRPTVWEAAVCAIPVEQQRMIRGHVLPVRSVVRAKTKRRARQRAEEATIAAAEQIAGEPGVRQGPAYVMYPIAAE